MKKFFAILFFFICLLFYCNCFAAKVKPPKDPPPSTEIIFGCPMSIPPFISEGARPNVLVILDTSNSMDENLFGEAVGSYDPTSKSVLAREALLKIMKQVEDSVQLGLITYELPSNVTKMRLYNGAPFASYDLRSYCPEDPRACKEYWNGKVDDKTKKDCEDACRLGPEGNPLFDITYLNP